MCIRKKYLRNFVKFKIFSNYKHSFYFTFLCRAVAHDFKILRALQ